MSTVATAAIDAEIFSELVGTESAEMPPEVARSILDLRFSDAQNARMRELADKNSRGVLTDAEQARMESFRRVGSFLSIMKAKARLSLKNRN
jgi:hypothetical protein